MFKSAQFVLLAATRISVLLLSAAGQAQVSAAAYINNARPTANNGGAVVLPVQSGVTSYLQFDLSALPHTGCIAKARLRLYVNAVVSPGMLEVLEVGSGWNENVITQANGPSLGASVTGSQPISISAANLNTSIEVDVTDLVQRWIGGKTPNNGIVLRLSDRGRSDASFSFVGKAPGDQRAAQIEADRVQCDRISAIYSNYTVTCVKSDEECTFDDAGATKNWTDGARLICEDGPCSYSSNCVPRTQPQIVHQVLDPDNWCLSIDRTKPKGCYSIATGVVQCECRK